MRRRASCLLLVLTVAGPGFFAASPASAQSPDAARAEALFQESKTLIDSGDYIRACPKLRESYRLDPAAGTLLALALCHEREGKTATAWSEFKETAALARKAGRADREKLARDHIAVLEPLLSRLTVTVVADGVRDLVVKRDGVVLDRREWGVRTPIDPGVHVVEAAAPGKKPWTSTMTVEGSNEERVVTIRLEDERAAAIASPPSPAPPAPPAPLAPPAPSTEPASGSGQRTVGFIVGGAGVVALGVGTYFGLSALSKNGDAKALCKNPSACTNSEAVDLGHEAHTAANISNVALLVGVAAVAVGAYFVLTSDPGKGTQVSAGPVGLRDGAGLSVRGQWF